MANTRRATQQSGAQRERDDIRAHVRRRLRTLKREDADSGRPKLAVEELPDLIEWLTKRTARYSAKAGGLGGRAKR